MKKYTPTEVCELLQEDERVVEGVKERPVCLKYELFLGKGWGGFTLVPLRIPESINIFVSPLGCSRHSQCDIELIGMQDRFFRIPLTEKDVINGKGTDVICQEIDSLIQNMQESKRPKVVTLTITCMEGLVGTNYSNVEKMLWDKYEIRFAKIDMMPILRENRRNHGVKMMEAIYQLINCPEERRCKKTINLIGNSSCLSHESDFFLLLEEKGYKIRQIFECRTIEEYDSFGEACLNVVLNPHSTQAAKNMKKKFGIPYIQFNECFALDEILENYKALENALEIELNYEPFYIKAKEKLEKILELTKEKIWASAGAVDYNAEKFMYDFARMGFPLKCIFVDHFKKADLKYYQWYEENIPELSIYPLYDLEIKDFGDLPIKVDFLLGMSPSVFANISGVRKIEWGCEEPFDFLTFYKVLESMENGMLKEADETDLVMQKQGIFDRRWRR